MAVTVTTTATATASTEVTATVTLPVTTVVTATVAESPVTNTKTVMDTETVTVTHEPEPSEPEADSAPTGLEIGGPGVTASDSDGSASIKVVSVKRETKAFSEYDDPPKYGNFVIFDILYTGTSGTFNYNPFDWTVRDADGRAYEMTPAFGFDGPELHSGTLSKGSNARGFVIFDAPKGLLTLEYAPGFGSAPAVWSVPA